MPSLLEALEKKYYADCQFDNEIIGNSNNTNNTNNSDNNTQISSISSSSSRGSGHQACNIYDIVMDDTMPASDSRLISVFIPRISPLKLVPELLVLNDCDIDCAGNFETIKEKCQRVRELDLAQNKLRDWKEVFHILKHMPRIEFLNLSKNQLMGPISDYYAPASISNLRSVVLNGTYLDWDCIDMLLEHLPKLDELHLSLNDYREVLLDTTTATATTTTALTIASDTDVDTDAENLPPTTTTQTTTTTTENEVNTNANEDSLTSSTTTTSSSLSTTNFTGSDTTSDTSSDLEANNSPRTSTAATATPTTATTTTKRLKHTTPHTALKTLHFTGNPIESWAEVCRLGRVFPALQNLVLAQCPIKTLQETDASTPEPPTPPPEDDDCPFRYFENLRFLNLSCANINTWDDIDRIARFPRLHHVRVKNWPLWERLECTEHERRQLLIARLPNVSLINGGGTISADEREDAERAFIRYYMDKPSWERPKRYDELVTKHGKLDPLVDVNLKPDKRVKILLNFRDQTEAKLVDIYCTVADLKVRLEKVVGLPPNKMRLYYVDQDYKEWGPELMKYPNKFLYSYNIQAGDEIIVDEKK